MGLRIPMTAVPQRTALSHSLGALAATLVGISEYVRHGADIGGVKMTAVGFEVVIGALDLHGQPDGGGQAPGAAAREPPSPTGDRIAPTWPSSWRMVGLLIALVAVPSASALFFVMVGLALLFGFLLVLPIGAADMPVVIALLNSYAGLADAAMGFVLTNRIQIITGSLDGTSGFLLSLLMCRAMNRSARNVMFGAFGKVEAEAGRGDERGQGHRAHASCRTRSPASSTARARSSSCRATGWRWPRPSTAWPSWPRCS